MTDPDTVSSSTPDNQSAAAVALRRREPQRNDPHLGPAMRALSPRQRLFVERLFEQPAGRGAYAASAREAGYGNRFGTSSAASFARIANRLLNDEKVIAAIAETTKKKIRSAAPAAVIAMNEIVSDQFHRDRLKAAIAILDRTDPLETRHNIEVTHSIVEDDPLSQLRLLKSLGIPREKLVELFGARLARYEDQLALDDGSPKPEVIDAEFTVVSETEGSQ